MKTPGKKQTPASEAAQEETNLVGRSALLEALCAALDRRREVIEVLEAAEDPDSAVRSMQSTLDLKPEEARAVLDMQLLRLTAAQREKTAAELAEAHLRLHTMRQESAE
ncbi:DNA gyrase subunit A [Brevibacterium sp.]|uniref:DNA gyrase subunit A n=1 Tax=Brevibacterium sp. TaxID=1701 RepID=UPI0026481748|nr:DNA gyrase subunit A [Brevibacterium sp.]MDN6605551.1 hypothetical protein [Brevibacterium sp.]